MSNLLWVLEEVEWALFGVGNTGGGLLRPGVAASFTHSSDVGVAIGSQG